MFDNMFGRKQDTPRIRYAVVGLGWIAQDAVLPAFAHADENSELTALVSSDPVKLAELSEKYGIKSTYTYEQYDECLRSGEIDAVYIALPNNMHMEYTVRAAEAGIHVLCEKPMANTVEECHAMIDACQRNGVKLMIAYRLHFEEANLLAVEIAQSGALGDLRFFTSLNTQNIESGNIRLDRELGGGPVDDMGIYCINAARYLFHAEPTEVFAFAESSDNPRFNDVDEIVTAVMRFPENRLAHFTCGFGESKISTYHVVGTLGDLRLDSAFSFATDIKHVLTIDGEAEETTYKMRDQFAPELIHFSNSILEDQPSEPSGEEGLVDMMIIEAIRQSIATGQAVRIETPTRDYRPSISQEIERRPVKKQELIHAEPPAADRD